METILKIEESCNIIFNSGRRNLDGTHRTKACEGYVVTTDKQVIRMGIDGDPQCCEVWGHFASEDDFDQFIGAELLRINLVDQALRVYELKESEYACLMFVNLETDRGVLQFVVYNDHNGYYSHQAFVESEQLSHSEYI